MMLSLLLVAMALPLSSSIGWIGLYDLPRGYKWTKKDCARQPGLSAGQTALCRNHREMMAYVQESAALARDECHDLMQNRRWDCTSLDKAPQFGYDLTAGTKESAFVHALSAASLTLTVARACLSGKIPGCACKVSGLFIKTNHTDRLLPTDFDSCPNFLKGEFSFIKKFLNSAIKSTRSRKAGGNNDVRVKMHNSRVGRNLIKENQPIRCRCHGVTGSCTMKHCMQQLPIIQDITANLLKKYDSAVLISRNQERSTTSGRGSGGRKKRRLPNGNGLLFTEESPSYCLHDGKYGTRGTKGRECDPYSKGVNGCMKMCCGRGAQMETIEIVERCKCKYVWCCYVKCEQCKKTRKRFTCI